MGSLSWPIHRRTYCLISNLSLIARAIVGTIQEIFSRAVADFAAEGVSRPPATRGTSNRVLQKAWRAAGNHHITSPWSLSETSVGGSQLRGPIFVAVHPLKYSGKALSRVGEPANCKCGTSQPNSFRDRRGPRQASRDQYAQSESYSFKPTPKKGCPPTGVTLYPSTSGLVKTTNRAYARRVAGTS